MYGHTQVNYPINQYNLELNANAEVVVKVLCAAISQLQTMHADGAFVVTSITVL